MEEVCTLPIRTVSSQNIKASKRSLVSWGSAVIMSLFQSARRSHHLHGEENSETSPSHPKSAL